MADVQAQTPPLAIRDDPVELKHRLEEAYAQLSLYARDLRRIMEAERSATRQLAQIKQQLPRIVSGAGVDFAQPAADASPPAAAEIELHGTSPAIVRAIHLCREVAQTDASVILTGPTGVGKEVAARTIHRLSPRRSHPFVAVNCAALPETLLESELFGHEKGAFTGATQRKPGHFEMAEGGTLLLDEIGEMPLSMQAKLLRALEQRCFLRVGGVQLIHCDVRIITATNRDLREEIKAGRFRSDLYYRLNVFPIDLPPLCERLDDLPMLIAEITDRFAQRSGATMKTVSDEAMAYLRAHAWPGNIRELRNVIERSLILAHNRDIQPQDLPADLIAAVAANADTIPQASGTIVAHSRLAANERAMVVEALTTCGWNKAAAARQLGISWDNLRYRIKKYHLKRPG